MALIVSSNSATSSLHTSSFSSSSSVTAIPTIHRLRIKAVDPSPKAFKGVRIQIQIPNHNARSVVAKASSETDGVESAENKESAVSAEVVVSVDKLPLESKLKERMEQKEKMKLAKKIRLRRKRLVRKRKLRKKGRWPPSKMKKLKNV